MSFFLCLYNYMTSLFFKTYCYCIHELHHYGNNNKIAIVIASLEAPVGNMRRILCSDWLLDRVRWTYLDCSGFACFDPAHRKRCVERTIKFRNFGQYWWWSRKRGRRQSFFILNERKFFNIWWIFFIEQASSVKIAGYYPLFFLFTDLGFVFIHKNA